MKDQTIDLAQLRLWITACGFVNSGGEARKALLHEILYELGRHDAKGLQVAFMMSAGVFIPAEHQHWPEAFTFLQDAGCVLRKIEHDDHPTPIQETMQWADLIYIEGGNPSYLLQWLRRKELLAELLSNLARGKPCVGASAGGMIFGQSVAISQYGKNWAKPSDEATSMTGLGIIPVSVWPHYGREVGHSAMRDTARALCGGEVLTLADGEYAYYGKERRSDKENRLDKNTP